MSGETPTGPIHWPTTASAWAGLIVTLAAAAYLFHAGSEGTAAAVLGLALGQLGLKMESKAVAKRADAAADKADTAAITGQIVADAVTQIAGQLGEVKAGVDNIRNDPKMPGTPTGGGPAA